MTKSRVFWGLLVILAAVFIVLNQLDLLSNGIGVWDIIITAIAGGCMISSLFDFSFSGLLIPTSVIICVFRSQLGLQDFSYWMIIGIAILLSIGLSLIFPKKFHWNKHFTCDEKWSKYSEHKHFDSDNATVEHNDEEYVSFKTKFGAATRYVDSDNFKKAEIECKFGAMELFFDNAIIQEDSAELAMDVAFAGVEIYVPSNWIVKSNVKTSLGDLEIKGRAKAPVEGENLKTLFLTGEVSLSGVEVIYVQ